MYKPISSYGIVGDLRTSALISQDGSVDWLCLPRFDSPSIFAAILDEHRGGRFRIGPAEDSARTRQVYIPETNILVTRFLAGKSVVELTDFMPVHAGTLAKKTSRLIRRVKAVKGTVQLRIDCIPAFRYASAPTEKIEIDDGGAFFHSAGSTVHLASTIELKKYDSGVGAEFTLNESQAASFILEELPDRRWESQEVSESKLDELEAGTAAYWRGWLRKCSYKGRWREVVHRSALVLQLLTYAPSGAIVAAPTSSLPEWVGGNRNWDYRYNWIRDAAYTIYALLRIGLFDEAGLFMKWIEERCMELPDGDSLQTVYAVDGSRDLHEATLDQFEGYKRSSPARVGNDAYKQLQLDIYGALIDAVYLYNKYAQPITGVLWNYVRKLVDWVADNWQLDDHGIWEVRGKSRPLVHSKVMCWVALDRGFRLSMKRSLPADQGRWLHTRDQVYEEVVQHGWNEQRRSFVQSYGSNILDASALMMPLVFFMTPDDPRMISTIDAISQSKSNGGLMSDGMLYRYESDTDDGVGGAEGTFNVCTLWLIEALTRMGRIRQANWLFEKMLSRASDLGLFSEQTSISGEQLGNFPQALTHMGLISAAYNLDKALDLNTALDEGSMAP
ncbi:MAG TPA: glycoside hydrolase family 15 protein [Candidatus Sulfotelmatobacter sp.]|nr:glycoside hydrolase family 15 protein [Candidatus Sulfotelmatobacter sp.]